MSEVDGDYKTEELIIFVIRNGLARLIMAGLLVVSYTRAMCEKSQLWKLAGFCYAGLSILAIEWWIILLKVHVYRQLVEYFWVNTGVAIFIMFTMPPLWFLRYAYFIQTLKDTKLQAKDASINLESYVAECWNLKNRNQLDRIRFKLGSIDEAIATVQSNSGECTRREAMNAGDWCANGICLMEQLPDEMLEQMIVLTTIFVRWMITVHLGLEQLITYFISTASDIVDFASTMVSQSDQLVKPENKDMMKAIIAAYFISLSQFSVNLSGKRSHNHRHDLIPWSRATLRQRLHILIDFLFGTEIWGIIAQMATEDGLLLGLRIVAVIKFQANTLENLFFAVKNILTIAIFTYYAAAISDSYARHRRRYRQYIFTTIRQDNRTAVESDKNSEKRLPQKIEQGHID